MPLTLTPKQESGDIMVDKNCITTISRIRLDPTKPTVQDIDITDIAHALSMLTRANGHFDTFFSVARHSINCALEAGSRGYGKRVQLLCLLHDAAEAYIGDMTRPLKLKIPYFSEIEREYQKIIFSKYIGELSEEEISLARGIDDAMLYWEFLAFNGEELNISATPISVDLRRSIKSIDETKREFLELFSELTR